MPTNLREQLATRFIPRRNLVTCAHVFVKPMTKQPHLHICDRYTQLLDHGVVYSPKGNRQRHHLLLITDAYLDPIEADTQTSAYCAMFGALGVDLTHAVIPSARGAQVLIARRDSYGGQLVDDFQEVAR